MKYAERIFSRQGFHRCDDPVRKGHAALMCRRGRALPRPCHLTSPGPAFGPFARRSGHE
jgi:hypothetical protein